MHCLSLWQPFASLYASGVKRCETRAWRPSLGRVTTPFLLAVHAGKQWTEEQARLARTEPFASALKELPGWPIQRHAEVSFGEVLGIVRIVAIVPTEEVHRQHWSGVMTEQEVAFGDYSPHRWAWYADKAILLPTPTATRGRQSLFDWQPPLSVVELIVQHFGAMP